MSVRVPQNKIVTGRYTIGKEYLVENTYKEYQGYYYETNGKTFAGKEFNTKSPILIKIDSNNINKLKSNPLTSIYGIISKIQLNISTITSQPKSDSNSDVEQVQTYYAKKINLNPISIKQIDKDTYLKVQKDSLYQTVSINANQSNLEQAEKEMPGIKAFLIG